MPPRGRPPGRLRKRWRAQLAAEGLEEPPFDSLLAVEQRLDGLPAIRQAREDLVALGERVPALPDVFSTRSALTKALRSKDGHNAVMRRYRNALSRTLARARARAAADEARRAEEQALAQQLLVLSSAVVRVREAEPEALGTLRAAPPPPPGFAAEPGGGGGGDAAASEGARSTAVPSSAEGQPPRPGDAATASCAAPAAAAPPMPI